MFAFRFFIISLKKVLFSFPKMILGFFVSLVFIAAVGAGTIYYISAGTENFKSSVAVYVPEDNRLLNLAVNAFENSDNIKELYNVIRTEKKEDVETFVVSGKAAAGIVFEKDFVNEIMSGKEGIPINVFVSDRDIILKSSIIKFADCYKDILEYVQAGIYSGQKIYYEQTGEKISSENNRNFNMKYINFVFSKNDFFDYDDGKKGISLVEYYISMLFPLFLILFSFPLGVILYSFKKCFYNCSECGFITVAFIQNLVIFIILSFITGLCICCFSLSGFDVSSNIMPALFELITISVIINTVFFISEGNVNGGMILFFAALLCSFFSGAIIPPSFLPDWIKDLYMYFPVYTAGNRFMSVFGYSYGFENAFYDLIIWFAGYTAVFIFGRKKWRLS